MAGTYFDGESGAGYSWSGVANLSTSYYSTSVATVNQSSFGDLIAGSWSIEESATPLDILDTSGSVGGVSATFKRNPQSIGNGPSATPAASSSYLQGQPCSFTHSLGTINGYITSVSPDGGTIGIDHTTPASVLNVNMNMPPFVEGSMFYSFTFKDASGNRLYYNDLAVMSDGNLILTGATTGTNATAVYDRFGNYKWGINHSLQGFAVDLDASGRIYVMHANSVERFNADGTGVTTIIPTSAYNLSRMAIDTSTGSIWLATRDTTAGQAIKTYNSSGTLIQQLGTFNFSGSYTDNLTYTWYTGMAYNASGGYLTIGASGLDANGVLQYYVNTISGATTTGPNYIGAYLDNGPHESTTSGLGIAYSHEFTVGVDRPIYFGKSGLYDNNATYLNTEVKALPNPQPGSLYGTDDNRPALATDYNGGIFALTQGTVYRMASGFMSANQAIECYLGAAGYRGTVSYGSTLGYHQDVGLYGIPLPYAVNFPGWSGNAWSKIKELCARTKRQITTDGSGIRILRTDNRVDFAKLDISTRQDAPKLTEAQPGAQIIHVTSQNVYVPPGNVGLLYTSDQNDTTLSVDFGGVSTSTLNVGVHASYIDQPIAITPYLVPPATVTDGPPFYAQITYSAYAIVDSSTPPLQVDGPTWRAHGGSLHYTPTPGAPGSVDVTLVGANVIAGYTGPFSVAYLLGGQKVPFFTMSGYGLAVNPTDFDVYTGAPRAVSANIDSQNLESVFIDRVSVGYDMARQSSIAQGNGEMSLDVSIPVSSLTVGLGSIAGSYFYWNRNYWRVVNVKISGGWADLTAVRDTRIFDVQDGSITHGTIDNTWAGYRYLDNYLSPGILGE